MPHREQFPNPGGYYQAALHERGHWTGHPDRMNRESLVDGIRQGRESLESPREEMRAEISSMITRTGWVWSTMDRGRPRTSVSG